PSLLATLSNTSPISLQDLRGLARFSSVSSPPPSHLLSLPPYPPSPMPPTLPLPMSSLPTPPQASVPSVNSSSAFLQGSFGTSPLYCRTPPSSTSSS